MKKSLRFALAAGLVLSAGIDVKAESLDSAELHCLALNIYHESRNQSIEGRVGVAFVTLNRVKSSLFPDTVCGVVWQRNQFSWTRNKRKRTPRDRIAFKQAQAIALGVTLNLMLDPTNNGLWYHTAKSKPIWRLKLRISGRIGDHIFYNGQIK